MADTSSCNFFRHCSLFMNCTCNLENVEIAIIFIETWWNCLNEPLFVKKHSLEFWKCIIVMFEFAHDFTHFSVPITLCTCYIC